jgi:collagenase-like PrtC family protease
MTAPPLELSLGPLLFNWPEAKVADFYDRIADSCIDRVYLGELVCGKRAPLLAPALDRAAERLAAAGKAVVRSSLALPATPRERALNRALARSPAVVEANDFGVLADRPAGAPFVAGPLLNVYNEDSARELVARGCVRLCANVELSLAAVGRIARACPGLALEVFAFGRLPLALSGRCHHAHAHGRNKDTCRYVCDQDPDGMALRTVEGAPFLAVNGVQTLSHALQLIAQPQETVRQAGVRALRLSPHSGDMPAVIAAMRRYADAAIDAAELDAAVRAATPFDTFVDGYLRGEAGLAATTPPSRPSRRARPPSA